MLPDGDGEEVLREIRGTSRVPVIMLTARGEEMDRVVGLELGADDYVAKPSAGQSSLLASGRSCGGAGPRRPADSWLEVGDLVMDLETHTVTQGGEQVDLTVKEFELLRMLIEHAGQVVSRNASWRRSGIRTGTARRRRSTST